MWAFRPPTQVLSCECCKFFKNSFFYGALPLAAFMSTRKGKRRRTCRIKQWGKLFQMTEENEKISINSYLQVLLLVKTEMQIRLCKYCKTAHPFFLTFSSNFLSCDSWAFIFCVFIPDKLKNSSCRIYQFTQKQAMRVVLKI